MYCANLHSSFIHLLIRNNDGKRLKVGKSLGFCQKKERNNQEEPYIRWVQILSKSPRNEIKNPDDKG